MNRQVADLKLVATIGDTRADGQLRYAAFESPRKSTHQLRLNQFTPAHAGTGGARSGRYQTGSIKSGGGRGYSAAT